MGANAKGLQDEQRNCCSGATKFETLIRATGARSGLVLAINAAMFWWRQAPGLRPGSASLQADALDFLGDAGNYVISLAVVGMALRYRAIAAMAKGATMESPPASGSWA